MSEFRVKVHLKESVFLYFLCPPAGRSACPDLGSTIAKKKKKKQWMTFCGPAARFQEAIWSSAVHDGCDGKHSTAGVWWNILDAPPAELGKHWSGMLRRVVYLCFCVTGRGAKLSLTSVTTSYVLLMAVVAETPPPGCMPLAGS